MFQDKFFDRNDPPRDGGNRSDSAMTLAAALAQAQAGLASAVPPPQVLSGLLAQLDARQAAPVVTQPATALALPGGMRLPGWTAFAQRFASLHWRIPSAAVASVCGVLVLLTVFAPKPVEPMAHEFTLVPLVSDATLAANPAAWLVPTEMSQSTLALLGAPFDPSSTTNVQAELLVNAQGDVLAVRLPL